MFRFHETTRKRVCRSAFVMLCVMPTLATFAWIGWRCRPSLAADQSAHLSAALRLDARLVDWREPRPGLNHTDRLTLLHSDNDGALVDLENLEVHHGNGTLRVTAGKLSLDVVGLQALAQHTIIWLGATQSTSITLTASELAFLHVGVKDSLSLHDLQISVEPGAAGGRKALLSAKLGVGAADVRTVRITIEQSRSGIVATLDLKEVEIPCWLIASAVPALAAANHEALFRGTVQWNSRDGVLRGSAQGQITGLALQSVMPSGSPHRASGAGTVSLLDIHWQGRRIESISGSARATGIELSASLVDAAVRSLYCKLGTTQPISDVIAIDRLACHFQFNRQGLTLTGELGAESNLPQGCLASSQGRMQLMQPAYVDLPLAAWVQFVAAPASSWLPATQEAVDIAERLPLPLR